jgi:hypothetical protein
MIVPVPQVHAVCARERDSQVRVTQLPVDELAFGLRRFFFLDDYPTTGNND